MSQEIPRTSPSRVEMQIARTALSKARGLDVEEIAKLYGGLNTLSVPGPSRLLPGHAQIAQSVVEYLESCRLADPELVERAKKALDQTVGIGVTPGRMGLRLPIEEVVSNAKAELAERLSTLPEEVAELDLPSLTTLEKSAIKLYWLNSLVLPATALGEYLKRTNKSVVAAPKHPILYYIRHANTAFNCVRLYDTGVYTDFPDPKHSKVIPAGLEKWWDLGEKRGIVRDLANLDEIRFIGKLHKLLPAQR